MPSTWKVLIRTSAWLMAFWCLGWAASVPDQLLYSGNTIPAGHIVKASARNLIAADHTLIEAGAAVNFKCAGRISFSDGFRCSGMLRASIGNVDAPADNTAPTTTPSVKSGNFSSPFSVTLTASEPASIFYTLDGSTPSLLSASAPSPASINISTYTNLRFFAVDNAGNREDVQSETYTFNILPSKQPGFTIDTPNIGAIPGSHAVTQNGSLSYSVPIQIPPGRAGMQPDLTLQYDSNAPEGPLGVGWRLQGLSSITRAPRNLAYDNTKTAVSFNNSDVFMLNGQRLIPISGQNGGDNTEYRLEHEPFSKVKSYGAISANGGPLYFKLWTKSGLIFTFGNSNDSRVKLVYVSNGEWQTEEKVNYWAVNKVEDTVGNYYVVSYLSYIGVGVALPAEIIYTRHNTLHDWPDSSKDYRIHFNYTDKPDAHITRQYIGINKYQMWSTRLLSHISIYEPDKIWHDFEYRFEYDLSPQTKRYRLVKLKKEDHNNITYDKQTPPTTFVWSNPNLTINDSGRRKTSPDGLQVKEFDRKYILPGDYKGDGKTHTVILHNENTNNPLQIFPLEVNELSGLNATDWGTLNEPDPNYQDYDEKVRRFFLQTDHNNDGKTDILYVRELVDVPYAGVARINAFVYLAGTNSFNAPIQLITTQDVETQAANEGGLASAFYPTYQLFDADGDGKAKLLRIVKKSWPSGGIIPITKYHFDQINLDNGTFGKRWIHQEYQSHLGLMSTAWSNWSIADFNRDGYPDIVAFKCAPDSLMLPPQSDYVAIFYNRPNQPVEHFSSTIMGLGASNESISLDQKWHIGDFDGDGFTDILRAKDDADGKLYLRLLRLSDENQVYTFTQQDFFITNYVYTNPKQQYFTTDYNSDGKTDLVRTYAENGKLSAEAFSLQGWNNFVGAKLIQEALPYDQNNAVFFPGDYNGDGVADYRMLFSKTENGIIKVWTMENDSDGKPVDMMEIITDGMGLATKVQYGIYHDASDPTPLEYPEVPFRGPTRIVESVTSDNLSDNGYKISYSYGNGRADRRGFGFKGFGWQKIRDEQTGIYTINTFLQGHPCIGYLLESKVYVDTDLSSSTPDLLKSSVYNVWNQVRSYGQPDNTGSQVIFPMITSSSSNIHLIDYGTNTSTLVSKNDTETTYDTYGNALTVKATVTGYGPLYGPSGRSHVTESTHIYSNITDNGKWLLGRLTDSTVKKYYLDVGAANAPVRKVAFEYDPNTGLLTKEITEPTGADNERLVTEHSYDAYGNETLKRITGYDINRASETIFDSNGVFPIQSKSYLNYGLPTQKSQVTSAVHEKQYGNVLSATDVNGLTVTNFYDGLGRLALTEKPDGTWSRIAMTTDLGEFAPSTARYKTISSAPGVPDSITFHDKLGRSIRSVATNFHGEQLLADTSYNSLGQVTTSTLPYKAGTSSSNIMTSVYDKEGRVIESKQMNGAINVSHSKITYLPLQTIEQVDRNGTWLTTTKYTDMLGNLLKTVDMNGASVRYVYDAYSNVTEVYEVNDNNQEVLLSTMTYDKLGRQLTMAHKDMGWNSGKFFSYKYKATGELFEQTDPKGNISSLYYDDFGRLIYKISAEDSYAWTYDTAKNGIGALAKAEITGSDKHRQTYQYDGFGRAFQASTTINGETFTSSTTFDELGRVVASIYPSGFSTTNVYNNLGFLHKVVSGTTVYWEAQTYNDKGQLTQYKLGNGLITKQAYDPNNGLLTGITTGTTSVENNVQDLAFTWDKVANLISRENKRVNKKETFEYDSLNRMVKSTVQGLAQLNYSYANNGNIKSKAGVGSYGGVINYTYDGLNNAGPHAVTSVTGAKNATYTYDFNGNLTSGDGRTLQYTNNDMVKSIQKGSTLVKFDYGIGGEARIQQTETSPGLLKVTKHVGSYEKVTTGTSVEEKHYIAGIAIYTKKSDNTQKTRYLHKDHLGSTECISNESGAVVETFAFDAFGQRRNPNNWSDLVLSFSAENIKEGFTGHEMLDSVGLIHMNARIYDPSIGRFMNADSVVDGVGHTQGQNRYSYVQNNPLSLTDPTGNWSLRNLQGAARTIGLGSFATLRNTGIGQNISNFITENRQYIKMAAAVAITIATGGTTAPLWLTMLGGFTSGMIMSGGDIKQGIIGAVTAGAFYGIGQWAHGLENSRNAIDATGKVIEGSLTTSESIARISAHSAIGGLSSVASGGEFRSGALSAGFSAGVNYHPSNMTLDIIAGAVLGGTGSVLGGGKFANGAVQGAMLRAYNDLQKQKEIYTLGKKFTEGLAELKGFEDLYNRGALAGIEQRDYRFRLEYKRISDKYFTHTEYGMKPVGSARMNNLEFQQNLDWNKNIAHRYINSQILAPKFGELAQIAIQAQPTPTGVVEDKLGKALGQDNPVIQKLTEEAIKKIAEEAYK